MAVERQVQGIGFPLLGEAGFRWVGGDEMIEQALRHLLLTEPGERIGRSTYGCGLRRFLFAPNGPNTRTLIRKAIEDAIRTWETRVTLVEVAVDGHPSARNVILINIRYRVNGREANLAFPFHLDEQV